MHIDQNDVGPTEHEPRLPGFGHGGVDHRVPVGSDHVAGCIAGAVESEPSEGADVQEHGLELEYVEGCGSPQCRDAPPRGLPEHLKQGGIRHDRGVRPVGRKGSPTGI